MAKVPNAVEIYQLPKYGARTLQTTDRQTTDGRAIAYSEREREFTFAKNYARPTYHMHRIGRTANVAFRQLYCSMSGYNQDVFSVTKMHYGLTATHADNFCMQLNTLRPAMFKYQSAFVYSDGFMRNFIFNLSSTCNGSRDILHSERQVQVRANLVTWCMLDRYSKLSPGQLKVR